MPSNRRRSRRICARRLAASCAAALIAAVLALTLAAPASADLGYTIQSGDTLSEIAEEHGTTVAVLQALNGIGSPNHIQVGQQIRIPGSSNQASNSQSSPAVHAGITTTQPGEFRYTVQAGDTAYGIAERLGVDLQDIRELNPRTNLNVLQPGQSIRVPAPRGTSGGAVMNEPAADPADSPASETITYTVAAGDNASLIAEKHGITLEELRKHNPRIDLDTVYVRQIIQVPVPAYQVPALDPAEAGGLVSTDYVVRSGDTASGIADLYGISLQELRNLNPLTNLNEIYIGQTIKAPWSGGSAYAPGTAPAVTARYRTHAVEAGQTFLGIANAYGLTLDELRGFNAGRGTDLIVIGERLKLGGELAPPVVAEDVVVEAADLVQYVAAAYGVTPHTLLSNNAWLGADDWVHVGAVLRIPFREGLLVTVQAGDTLRGIAAAHGVDMDAILADTGFGVDDPNMIVIGQEIIMPLAMPDFVWPTHSLLELTDPFGLCRNWDCSYRHRGLDMAIDAWEPILAAADGLVVFVGGDPGWGLGWYIEIEHPNGWRTVYAHLSDFAVYQGQLVKQGELIGYNGTTGESTGPHLHFEVHHNDWYVDPAVVLPPLG